MSKISGNFWAENGYSLVEGQLKKGSKAIDMLASYLAERAKLEENYAKDLTKLLKKTEATSEIGSVNDLWIKARAELENEGNLHMAFYQELKNHSGTVSNTAKELSKQRKKLQEDAQKLNKEFVSLSGKVNSAKSKYEKQCQENQKIDAEVAAAQGNPKNLPKAQQKQQDGIKKAQQCEQDYKIAIQKLVEYQPTWEKNLISCYDSLQDIEIQRLEAVKKGWDNFQSAFKGMSDYIDTAVSNISKAASSADPKKDISNWVDQNKSGTSPPPHPTFQQFGGGSGGGGVSSANASPRIERSEPKPSPTLSSSTTISSPTPPPPPSSSPVVSKVRSTAVSTPPSGTASKSSSLPKITPPTSKAPTPASAPPPPSAQEEEYAEEEYSEEYAEEYTEEYGEEEYAEEEYAEEEYAEEYAEEYGEYETATAQWDYEAGEENELSFKAGEKITIVSKEDPGWWNGTNEAGASGMFPANYVVIDS